MGNETFATGLDTLSMGSFRPAISACLIVKNEERHIERALNSLAGVADEIVVVDTGSSDSTVEKARALGAKVFFFEWIDDFSAARNYSLEQATGEWILVFDADEELVAEDQAAVLAAAADPAVDAYYFTINDVKPDGLRSDYSTQFLQMFRNRSCYRYEGAIHEQIVPALLRNGATIRHAPVRVNHYGYQPEVRFEKDKGARNMRILEKQREQNPHDPFVYFNLGQEHVAAGDLEEAIRCFTQSLSLVRNFADGFVPPLLVGLVDCLTRAGRFDAAEKTVALGKGIFPDYTDLLFLEARLLAARGMYGQAIATYLRCMAQGDAPSTYAVRRAGVGSHLAWFELGQVYERMGHDDKALDAYRRSLLAQPAFVAPVPALIRLLVPHEEPGRIRDFLSSLMPQATVEAFQAMAAGFAERGFHPEALAALESAQRLAPRGARADRLHHLQGLVLLASGRLLEAEEAWGRITPDTRLVFLESRFHLAVSRLLEGDAAGARTALDVLRGIPRYGVHLWLASLWAEALGVPAGREAAATPPGAGGQPLALFLHLFSLALRLGKERCVQAGLAILPRVEADRVRALGVLVRAYYHAGREEAAIAAAKEMVAQGGEDAEVFSILGNLALERGLWRDAVQFYLRSAEVDPRNPEVHLAAARLLNRLGEGDAARSILRRALEQLPQSQLLRESLALLENEINGAKRA